MRHRPARVFRLNQTGFHNRQVQVHARIIEHSIAAFRRGPPLVIEISDRSPRPETVCPIWIEGDHQTDVRMGTAVPRPKSRQGK